jgi:hypothetical protein
MGFTMRPIFFFISPSAFIGNTKYYLTFSKRGKGQKNLNGRAAGIFGGRTDGGAFRDPPEDQGRQSRKIVDKKLFLL